MAIHSTVNSSAPLEDEEVVAALAAVQTYLAAELELEQDVVTHTPADRWHDSAKLVVQSLQPMRTAIAPRWSTIERLRRTAGGRYGVTGL